MLEQKRLEQRLLSTKLQVPRSRPLTVERPRLVEAINQTLNKKMTLISGPAGSGKSTLLSEWASQTEIPTAWLTLEKADDDPLRFVSYLTGSLAKRVADFGQNFEPALNSRGEIDLTDYIESLIISVLDKHTRELILVLDDVHWITNEQIHNGLNYLIYHMPDHVHLVFASRSVPPLNLSKLRLCGELNEIHANELRFHREEACEFYNHVMALSLDEETIEKIEDRTEGWIAACLLAALHLKQSHNHHKLIDVMEKQDTLFSDFLAEEILQHLSESVREFLTTTSILQRLCDPLCAAVMGTEQSVVLLHQLEKENLLISNIDDNGHWYRYHPLFIDFLNKRLIRTRGAQLIQLHRRASQWFADAGLMYEAVEHAIASGDQPWLVHLVERFCITLLSRGELNTLRVWLEALDDSLLDQRPVLALADAWYSAFMQNRLKWIEVKVRRAQETVETHLDNVPEHLRKSAVFYTHTISAFTALRSGNYRFALTMVRNIQSDLLLQSPILQAITVYLSGYSYFVLGDCDRALPLLDKAAGLGVACGQFLTAFSAMGSKATLLHIQLKLHEALTCCNSALALAKEKSCSHLPVMGYIHIELGVSHFFRGQYTDAKTELELGIKQLKHMKVNHALAMAYCYLARVKHQMGDIEGARAAHQESFAAAHHLGNPDILACVDAFYMIFCVQQGQLAAAEKWQEECDIEKIKSIVMQENINLIRIAVRMFNGTALPEIRIEIEESIIRTTNHGYSLFTVVLRLLKTVALCLTGVNKEASVELEKAAEVSMRSGLVVYFDLWAKNPVWSAALRPVLEGIKSREVREFVDSFLYVPPANDLDQSNTSSDQEHQLNGNISAPKGQVLSSREIEVLEHLAQGLSNQETAKKLFISLSTVKAHVRKIHEKLGVSNRSKAIYIARKNNWIHQ